MTTNFLRRSGKYQQVLLEPTNAAGQELFLPEGVSCLATPLGSLASCSRQNQWDLTTSLLPIAWLIEVNEGPSRAPGHSQALPDSIDVRGQGGTRFRGVDPRSVGAAPATEAFTARTSSASASSKGHTTTAPEMAIHVHAVTQK